MDTDNKKDYTYRIMEVVAEARHILEHAEEAQYHFKKGDLQSMADVLSLSHYKISAFSSCRTALLEKLAAEGFKPGKGGKSNG